MQVKNEDLEKEVSQIPNPWTWEAGPQAHLALQVNGRVTVGEIFPKQQRVFILFPRQAVTVIIKIKGLSPMGMTLEGMTEQKPGPTGDRNTFLFPGFTPPRLPPGNSVPPRHSSQRDMCLIKKEFNSFEMQNVFTFYLSIKSI
jgi:hypothetical protein